MRVAFDVRALQTKSAQRGIGTYVRNMVRPFLESAEPEFHFLAFAGEPLPGIEAERIIAVPRGRATGHLTHLLEGGALERALVRRGIDVVHHPSIFEFTFGTVNAGRRVRTAATIFDLIPLRFPREIFAGKRRCLEPFYRAALRRAGAFGRIVTSSESTRRDLAGVPSLDPARVAVIPLGIDERYLARPTAEAVEAFRRARRLPDEFVLYVGGFSFNKNVPGMLEAHRLLVAELGKTIPLVLAGPMDPRARRSIDDAVARLGLHDLVVLPGFIPDDELPLLYRTALVFLFASHFEGFGLPPLEAMASGVPVVASKASSLPEVLGDAALLVDPDNPRAIAQALGRLIEDPRLREEQAERGVRQASLFTWARTAREHVRLYEELAGES